MTDLTHGINPYQSVEGMVHDYEKKVAQEEAKLHDPDVIDTPRSQMDVSREGERLVAKGRLCRKTGREIPLTAKALPPWPPSNPPIGGLPLGLTGRAAKVNQVSAAAECKQLLTVYLFVHSRPVGLTKARCKQHSCRG
jgi:hypothetical protein